MDVKKEYIRLCRPRARTGFFIAFTMRSSLWLGSDHLLCVDTTGYTESYKRFYFRDIQAITLHQSKRRAVWNVILGVPALLFAILAAVNIQMADITAAISLSIIAGVFVGFLLLNTLSGPTTVCYLRTAVQIEELAPLRRLRRARKILARLRPYIAQAQGQIAPEELPTLMHQLVTPAAASPSSLAPANLTDV